MKKCPACAKEFSTPIWSCPGCAWAPVQKDGALDFLSAESDFESDYPSSIYERLAQLESRHFWFRRRNELIVWALKTFCPDFQNFMEIGCGTGCVLEHLTRTFAGKEFHGSDCHTRGLGYARERARQARFYLLDARDMPFAGEFDAIGIFDVLEHIEDDESVLRSIGQSLKAGGKLLLTVPQHAGLWSRYDELAGHKRRYSVQKLIDKLERHGFSLIHKTSFMMFLLPLVFLSRAGQGKKLEDYLEISPFAEGICDAVMKAECFFIKRGIVLPWGSSLFVVAEKRPRT